MGQPGGGGGGGGSTAMKNSNQETAACSVKGAFRPCSLTFNEVMHCKSNVGLTL